MKPAELRGMSDEHLALTLKDTVKNLFHLRFQSATERLETPSEIRKAKKDIARIKTIQRERERAAQKKAAEGAKSNG
jgi:large subunit ribosomal protein L29